MIGSFGETVFTSSFNKVLTYSGLNKTADARFAEHALIGRKPLLEFVGPSLNDISFSIRLDSGYGVNPESEIEKLTLIRDSGTAKPLFIGDKYHGDFVIVSLIENRRITNPRTGLLSLADLSITIKEYVDARS